jgi:spermidine synthase
MTDDLFFKQKFKGGELVLQIDKILYYGRSKFQNILIAHSPYIGHFLALDNKINSSEIDYFIYHEALIHPCMATLNNPMRVLVIGGGEGTPVKELLKYKGLKIDWVDIDKEVVKKCREFLPYAWKGESAYVNLIIQDGFNFLNNTKKKYDFIIGDLTEPGYGDGISNKIYSKKFAEIVKSKLTDQGIYITLCWESDGKNWKYTLQPKYLLDVFKIVRPIHFFMPSFLSDFNLVIASKKYDPMKISKKQISRKINEFRSSLFFYDENIHKSLFVFPKYKRVLF